MNSRKRRLAKHRRARVKRFMDGCNAYFGKRRVRLLQATGIRTLWSTPPCPSA